MNIAVNTRLLLPNKLEGIGWFTYESFKRITRQHPEHRFIFLFDRKYDEQFVFGSNVTPLAVHPQARHPLLWYLFFEYGVATALKKHKADLFISPDGWLSLRTGTSSMAVIHDLNFFHFPEFIPWHVRQYYNYYFPRFINKADRIATVSAFTKKDIIYRFGYDAGKIDVVYNGANEEYKPLVPADQQQVREKYTQGKPYFLFVGLIHPRKNLANVMRAFDAFRQVKSSDMKLLVVGSKKWWDRDHEKALREAGYNNDIIFAGRMEIDELKGVMASAFALVYPSWFEGFGIPVLEAMYCDVPVITSGTSSMSEVGGEAVLYADPASVESIKNAMLQLYSDDKLRNNLIVKARDQRLKFSWDMTAEKLWESIEKCLDGIV